VGGVHGGLAPRRDGRGGIVFFFRVQHHGREDFVMDEPVRVWAGFGGGGDVTRLGVITHASIVTYAHDSTADTDGAPPGSIAGPATPPSTAAPSDAPAEHGSPSAFLFPAVTDPTTPSAAPVGPGPA